MKQELRNTSFLLPPDVKKALDLVAADQDSTASELLRRAATEIVTTYKDGCFFKMIALHVAQYPTEGEQK